MLPFLKLKQSPVAGLIIKSRAPDESKASEPEDAEDPSAAIHSCAAALLKAIESKDVKAMSEALSDAFEILDSMPHEEGEHIEPHSYDSQNAAAANKE